MSDGGSFGFVQKDVQIARQAQHLIKVTEKRVRVMSQDTQIPLIAVVGPVQHNSYSYREAVLMEVGANRSRPYQPIQPYTPGGRTKRHYMRPRTKAFGPTHDQYNRLAPRLFSLLQELTDRKVETWKSPIYWLPFPCRYFKRHGRQMLVRDGGRKPVSRGVRFCVSRADPMLVSDLYWAEFNMNSRVQHIIAGLAGFMHIRLSRTRSRSAKEFKRTKAFADIAPQFETSWLSRHLLAEALQHERLKRWHHHPIMEAFGDLIEWNGQPTSERHMAQKVVNGVDPRTRIGMERELRIVRKTPKHIVVEMQPSKKILDSALKRQMDVAPGDKKMDKVPF